MPAVLFSWPPSAKENAVTTKNDLQPAPVANTEPKSALKNEPASINSHAIPTENNITPSNPSLNNKLYSNEGPSAKQRTQAAADAKQERLLDAVIEDQLNAQAAGKNNPSAGIQPVPGKQDKQPVIAGVAGLAASPAQEKPQSQVAVKDQAKKQDEEKKEPDQKWKVGISAGAGVADIFEQLFTPAPMTNSGYYTTAGYLNYSTNSAAAPPHRPGRRGR